MKALVYHGPGEKAWETVPDPTIEAATDVIVKITSSTICTARGREVSCASRVSPPRR